jgi:integrase
VAQATGKGVIMVSRSAKVIDPSVPKPPHPKARLILAESGVRTLNVDSVQAGIPAVKRRRYQRGWVETEGARGRKQYVGRWRAQDGSKPKMVLGYVSEMSLSEARTRIEAHVRGLGSRPTSAAHITFKDYWTLHFKPRRKVRWSEPTEEGYDQYMNAYLSADFGNVRVADIDPQQIAAFFDKLRKNHSRSVVQKVWTLFRAILEDAVDYDFIGKNPMRRVPIPKTKLPKKPVLETQLVPKVLKRVESDARNSAILHIGIFCAMRPSEVFGLRWKSFRGDHFVIRDSAWKGKLLEDQAKAGERSVFIPPVTRAAILRWRDRSKNTGPEDLMFASKKRNPLIADNFRKRVLAKVQKELELGVPLTFQVLRRSHATRNQKTPKDAQAHLGHKTLSMTLGTYAQVIPDSVREMVERDEREALGQENPDAAES